MPHITTGIMPFQSFTSPISSSKIYYSLRGAIYREYLQNSLTIFIKDYCVLMLDYFCSSLEALAFMVSCLCHDLDHRGTTNSFQMQSGTELASLYSSEGSVMEVSMVFLSFELNLYIFYLQNTRKNPSLFRDII